MKSAGMVHMVVDGVEAVLVIVSRGATGRGERRSAESKKRRTRVR